MTRWIIAATVGALALVLLVVTFGLTRPATVRLSPASAPTRGSTQPVPEEPEFGPTGTLGTSDDPNFAPARQRVEQALAGVAVLPGGVRQPSAPTAALARPSSYVGTGNLIDRASFWRAPGTMAGAIAFFRAHPPAGLACCSTATGSGESALTFGPFAPDAGRPQVQVAVVSLDAGVAVRVDAMEIWIPTKPTSAYIGAVDSVDITVTRPDVGLGHPVPTVRRTLTGAVAQRLADAVDALPVATSGLRSCPADFGFTDQLTFHTRAGRTVAVAVRASGCAFVGVSADGAGTVLSGTIDPQVMAALGLPATYGR